jgi:hypothetical protein
MEREFGLPARIPPQHKWAPTGTIQVCRGASIGHPKGPACSNSDVCSQAWTWVGLTKLTRNPQAP